MAVGPSKYDRHEIWKLNCPAQLQPAVGTLRDSFFEAHWKFGSITEQVCYCVLHGEQSAEFKEIYPQFMQLKVIVGKPVCKHFKATLDLGTLPAIFKAFLDLYRTAVAGQMLVIFDDLVEIGEANRDSLGGNHYLDWAKEQASDMVALESDRVMPWIRRCCDVTERDPGEDGLTYMQWSTWQAPKLLKMQPAHQQPYELKAVWERLGVDESRGLLRHFETTCSGHLQHLLKRAWEEATIQKAKHPRSGLSPATTSTEVPSLAKEEMNRTRNQSTPRQRLTKKKHEAWKRQYRILTKRRLGMSDVWYSEQIARMPIAEGAKPETIRKNMKP